MGEARLTHAELDEAANRLANVLRGLGIDRGDRVACWADTSLDVLPLFAALAKLGAVFAPLNARLGAEATAPVAKLVRARMLVSDSARAEASEAVAKAADIPLLARLGGGRGPGVDLGDAVKGASENPVATPTSRSGTPT